MRVTKILDSFYEVISPEPWYTRLFNDFFNIKYDKKFMLVCDVKVVNSLVLGKEYYDDDNVVWICTSSVDDETFTVISDPTDKIIYPKNLYVYNRDNTTVGT